MGYYPSGWTQQHPKCALSSSLGESTHIRDYPRALEAPMDLMASLKFVQAYMDNLLIITRGKLDKNFQKMETVLIRLHDAGLKVNAAKSLFCAHEIEYLGYILAREGIKPQPKKVQAILVLNLPNNVNSLSAKSVLAEEKLVATYSIST
jgi:hypothetical protein